TAQAEKEALEQAQNTLVQAVMERAPEVWGLREHLTQWEVWSMEEAEEWGMAPEGGSLWAELEAARWREDWLANKAASELGVGAPGSLGWCLHSICIDSRRIGTDVHGSASGVAAGDGEGGKIAGGALVA
ncbi:hypothetical protein C0989_006025, partial [Termitomyces sp. Mn162]